MANNCIKIIKSMHFFLLIFYLSQCAFVEGRKTSTKVAKKHKHAIKTIRTESGDLVDCVSLYKQPALDHPLLKNHKIQMRPSRYPETMKKEVFENENNMTLAQIEIVDCPEGTIPILRTAKCIDDQFNPNATTNTFPTPTGIQDAYFWFQGGLNYQGVESHINVWKPHVASQRDFSAVFMWVQAGNAGGATSYVDIAGAGWMVNPAEYDDYSTRFSIFWTRDNFQTTGCINCRCKAFMQVDRTITPGCSLIPSTYGTQNQQYIHLSIYRDEGNWWVTCQDKNVGYWPKEIFTDQGLAFGAETLAWGGRVSNYDPWQKPYTEMGSGHFPYEGYTRACSIRNMLVFNYYNNSHYYRVSPNIDALNPQITDPMCYYAQRNQYSSETYMYVGGSCQ